MMCRHHLTLNEKMQLIGGYNRGLGLQDVSIGDHRMTTIVFIDVDSETSTFKEWFGIHETIAICESTKKGKLAMLFSIELKVHYQNLQRHLKSCKISFISYYRATTIMSFYL